MASTVAVGMSMFSVGVPAAHADTSVPVTFAVTAGGGLAIASAATATTLINGTAVDMPVTTVTDTTNATARTGSYTVTATASVMANGTIGQSIPGTAVALAQSGTFTTGTGTPSGLTGSFTVSGDTINSVYTYTPTATLTVPSNAFSGTFTGTIGQTVV